MKSFITVDEAAKKWGISKRRVQLLCSEGRVDGAKKHASVWAIPDDAKKPEDRRLRSSKLKLLNGGE